MPPILEARNIWVVYGDGTIANKGVSISIEKGEIHGLLGENGAGKTTLVKVLYGVVQPVSGEIYVEGSRVERLTPSKARSLGIFMVPQHSILVSTLTGYDNIKLSYPYEDLDDKLDNILSELNVLIELDKPVHELPRGMLKKIEVIRALISGAKLIILDEPTSVMSPIEVQELIRMLDSLANRGVSFIYISHRLDEVVEICDRITVLRDGSVVYTGEVGDVSEVYRKMFRSDLSYEKFRLVKEQFNIERVKIDGLLEMPKEGVHVILGVEGNGQDVLARRIVSKLGEYGFVGFVPGKIEEAIVPNMSLVDNLRFRVVDDDGLDYIKLTERIVERYEVITESIYKPISKLSGGNIQRFVVGRELELSDKYTVLEFPTRGLDMRSMKLIHRRVQEAVERGVSIIYFTEDIEEALEVGDLISIIYRGRLNGPYRVGDINIDKIKMLMSGIGW